MIRKKFGVGDGLLLGCSTEIVFWLVFIILALLLSKLASEFVIYFIASVVVAYILWAVLRNRKEYYCEACDAQEKSND